MSQAKAILIIVVVLTLTLVGMVAKKQYTLNTGSLIVLETMPVDPRSLFRGDYVRLNYGINRLNTSQFPLLHELKEHDSVFVALKKQGEFWQPATVSKSMLELKDGMVIIKGSINSPSRGGSNPQVSIKYGIENYFVPEGEGRALEKFRNQRQLSMQIAVDSFGNAGIKAVLLDGQPIYVESLF